MGVPGGMPGTAEALVAAVQALPAGCSWSATGIGRTSLPVALAALVGRRAPAGRHGGHADLRPGPPVTGNEQLVARAAELARLAQRPPMSTDEARALLRVKDRRGAVREHAGETR